MKSRVLVAASLAVLLGTTACDEQPTEPAFNSTGGAAALAVGGLPAGLDRAAVRVPAGARVSHLDPAAANPAIDPGDYVCQESTPVADWYVDAVLTWRDTERDLFDILYVTWLADLIPTYEALYFATEDTPQYFGYSGEYTKVLQKTRRDAGRFWNIDGSRIQLIGLHGTVLQDTERTAATYEFLFGLPPALAQTVAEIVKEALNESELLDGGNHPLFSFNAFAISAPGFIPDKIVMGDGILAGYQELGLGDVAPQGIYMHEYAHHIQYQKGYFDDPYATEGDPPEQTRYTELMADAMSAYFLTHKRGLALNRHRVAEFLDVFFQIGDCAFDNSGHHGTPNQRMRAAQLGFDVADQARSQGHVLTAEQFHTLFVAAYPDIIAPDAP